MQGGAARWGRGRARSEWGGGAGGVKGRARRAAAGEARGETGVPARGLSRGVTRRRGIALTGERHGTHIYAFRATRPPARSLDRAARHSPGAAAARGSAAGS
jgi:hypothetical protein